MADKDRLEKLLAWVQRYRENLYPPDWTADPLYHVQRELEHIIKDPA